MSDDQRGHGVADVLEYVGDLARMEVAYVMGSSPGPWQVVADVLRSAFRDELPADRSDAGRYPGRFPDSTQ